MKKMTELKIKNFKKNETDILKFSPADVTIIDEGSSKVYTGDLVFDEEKACISLENYKIKKLILQKFIQEIWFLMRKKHVFLLKIIKLKNL